MIYDYVQTKPPLNEETLAHYGVKGMRWGHRKRQLIESGFTRRLAKRQVRNERKNLNQDVTKSRYKVITKSNGKSYIADQSGNKMSRGDYKDMQRMLKKKIKSSGNKKAYKDYKKTLRATKKASFFGNSENKLLGTIGTNVMNKNKRNSANQQMNSMIANYTNTYLSNLRKKKKGK